MGERTNKSEAQLKAAVIDRLFANSYVDNDSVLISEMTVANWARRADVVLANGKLWAFEIKSDSDSLSRLPGQIETFRNYFEKFTVVAAERFEDAIMAMVPEGVGVWIADSSAGLKQRIAPRQIVLSRGAYISLMTASELKRLLASNGIKMPKGTPRATLDVVAAGLPVSDLACAAREAVKRRHQGRFQEFMRHKKTTDTLDAIRALHRLKPGRVVRAPQRDRESCPLEEVEIPNDHPLLVNAPAGPVLKRLIS